MNGRCSKDIVTYNHRKYFCINILFVKGVCMFDGIAKHEVVEREVVEHDCFFFFFLFFFLFFVCLYRSKAVLLLWFLTVLAVCVYTLVHLLC